MEKIYWNKLNGFKKFIFVLGWFGVLNLLFWIALLIYHVVTKEKRFFTPGSYRVVYIFGILYFIALCVAFLLLIMIMPVFVSMGR